MQSLYKKIHKIIFLVCVGLLMANCASVEKFNQKITQPIPVEKLQADINFTQHKLEKLYPSLYTYISKEQLNAKFDSIRNVIKKPINSKEFFFLISPVIASIRQGHMSMSPVAKQVQKKEAKRLKKAGDGPLSQLSYEWQNNKMYVIKNKSKKKTIKPGAEIVSINAILPQEMYKKYSKTYTSDGFNTTFLRKFFTKRFSTFMINEIGINDSLTFVFKQNDSIFSEVISRNKPLKKAQSKPNDSLKVASKPIVDKAKIKADKKKQRIYGYDKTTKEYCKTLRIISTDSSVAVLKIKNFSQGRYYTTYEKLFDSIKNNNIKTLVIDIRDNPGGRVAEVVDLYSYLTNKDYVMLEPAIVTSKTSLWRAGLFKQIPKITYPIVGAVYPIYMGFSYLRTKRLADGTFTYGLTGSKKRKFDDNHFTGKIYVLINGGSFSASCILSNALKTNPNITFVGEETGGAFNGTVAGLMPVLELPNSKIPWRIGLMDIQSINQAEVKGRGIFPDKEIIPTIQDKIANKDPELEWILEDSKNKKR
jgi:hypothetical protein